MKPEELWNALKLHMEAYFTDPNCWDQYGLEMVTEALAPRAPKRDEIEQASMAAQALEIFVDKKRRVDMHNGFVKGAQWAMEKNVRRNFPSGDEIKRNGLSIITWDFIKRYIGA